jgi:hypothetical protein
MNDFTDHAPDAASRLQLALDDLSCQRERLLLTLGVTRDLLARRREEIRTYASGAQGGVPGRGVPDA